MGIEKIIELVWDTAVLPVKTLDNTLKIAHDAVADVSERYGFDRFTLAQYATVGFGGPFYYLIADELSRNNYGGAALVGFYGLMVTSVVSSIPSKVKEYLLKPKDALDYGAEYVLQMNKFCRLMFLGIGVGFAFSIDAETTKEMIDKSILVGGLLSTSSAFYLMDTDHSLWDKSKNLIRKGYQALSNLIPHLNPLPNPEPAMSYK